MSEANEQRQTYKFTSPKFGNTELVDMGDGRVAAQGQEIELTEAEAEKLKAVVNLRKADESGEEKAGDSPAGDSSGKVSGDSRLGGSAR